MTDAAVVSSAYAALEKEAADLKREIEPTLKRYPHTQILIEVGDRVVTSLRIAPLFIKKQLDQIP